MLLVVADVTTWVPQAANVPQGTIVDAIELAQGLADEYCLCALESGARDQYFDIGSEQAQIVVTHVPITAITQIDEDAQADSPDTLTTDDYIRDDTAGIITRDGGSWTAGTRAVRIQYTAGYTIATLPNGLKRALLQMVAWIFESQGNVGVRQETVDGYATAYEAMDGVVPESIGQMLRPWKRTSFG
jgi:hypothetical protein